MESSEHNKLPNYQAIFTSIEEATHHDIEQSKHLGVRLHVIQTRNLYYVDANGKIRSWENLHSTYENGKEVGKA